MPLGYLTFTLSCKNMLPNKAQHSPIKSSYQENNLRFHFHTCPPTPTQMIHTCRRQQLILKQLKQMTKCHNKRNTIHPRIRSKNKGFHTVTNHSSQVIIKPMSSSISINLADLPPFLKLSYDFLSESL